jgi:hypothetical protein
MVLSACLAILFNEVCVGLAFRQDKLYMLAMHDNTTECVGNVCEIEHDSTSTNESKKRKRIDESSSKLWHCRLGHISRVMIERLVQIKIMALSFKINISTFRIFRVRAMHRLH